MFESLRRLVHRVGSLNRSDQTEQSGERGAHVDNVDAMAGVGPLQQSGQHPSADANFPPGYVKSYDEGRPRK